MSESGKNILLVEDEMIIALSEKMELEQFGYSVKIVNSGENAIEELGKDHDTDLILMDINLGRGIDGTQAAEKILKEHDIPVVFLSSHSDPEVVNKTEKITSYGYVLKNSSINVLDASIKMALKLFHSKKGEQMASDKATTILKTLPDALYQISKDGDYIDILSGDDSIQEKGRKEIIGKNISEDLQKDTSEMVLKAIETALETDTLQVINYVKTLPHGPAWFEARISRLNDNEVLTLVLDITERKKGEEEIVESRENLRITLESIGEAVIATDIHGKIVRMNPVAEGLCGSKFQNSRGRDLDDVFHIVNANTREPVKDPVKKVMSTGKMVGIANNTMLISKDGIEYQIADSAAPIRDDSGKIKGVVLVFRDVTEHYRTEKLLKERVKELNCLYGLGEIEKEPDITLEEILQKTASFIPMSWQYAESATCRIILHGKEYLSKGFKSSNLMESSDVLVDGKKVGTVEVVYPDDKTIVDKRPFLEEEKKLLDELAERLGRMIERKQRLTRLREHEREIEDLNSILLSIRNINQDIVKEQDFDEILSGSCKTLVEIRGYLDVCVAFRDERTGELTQRAHFGAHENDVWNCTPGGSEDIPPCIRRMLSEKHEFILNTGEEMCANCSSWSHENPHQSILVPIIDNSGDLMGIIKTCHEPGRAIHHQEVELLKEVADDLKSGYEKISGEKKLKESEERYRLLAENTRDAIWTMDMDMNFTYVNPTITQMTGYTVEEFENSKLVEHVDARYFEIGKEHVTREIEKGPDSEGTVFEAVMHKKSGEPFWVEIRTNVIFGKDDRPISIQGTTRDITDRKKAEKELLSARESFYRAFISSPAALAINSMPDGKYVIVNDSYTRIMGCRSEDLIGRTVTDLDISFNKNDLDKFEHELLEKGAVRDQEITIKRKNGTFRTLLASIEPVVYNNEETILSTFIDITRLREHEKEIDDLNSILLSIRNINQDIAREQDFDEILSGSCKTLVEIRGYMDVCVAFRDERTGELTQRAHSGTHENDMWNCTPGGSEDMPPCIRRMLSEKHEFILNTGEEMCANCSFWSHDIAHRSILVPIIDHSGDLMGIIKTYLEPGRAIHHQEVELLKEVADDLKSGYEKISGEKKLKESEERYRLLAENTLDAIWAMDMDMNFTYVNPAITQMTGYTVEEWENSKLRKHCDARNFEIMIEQVAGFIGEGEDLEGPVIENVLLKKNGEPFRAETRGKIVFGKDGQPISIQGVTRDITKRKQAEDEIKQQIAEKEILLKEVHHRVKNNLANIEALLSLQANSSTNEDVRSALIDTHSRVKSMRLIYEKLLVGKDYTDISMKGYAENLIDSIVAVFPFSKNVTLEKKISDFNINTKKAIPIGIIINELLTNVFKYAFKGRDSGHISIIIDKTENMVDLTIHDNGIGIDDKKISNKTSGFGITLVKMLARQLDGDLRIENDNGTLSTLKFKL